MKHRGMIWILALILAVSCSVSALADDVITYKDENGNTITVEVGDHDSNTDSGVIVLPEPEPTQGTQQGGTTAPQKTPAPSGNNGSSGGSESDSDVIVLPSADEQDAQNAPEDGEDPDAETDEDGDDARQSDEDSDADGAKAKSKSDGKLPATTAYVLIAILAVILIAGVVYLVRSRKKK